MLRPLITAGLDIACRTLPVVESVTDFGITYDNKLKFGLHIDKTSTNLLAVTTLACA